MARSTALDVKFLKLFSKEVTWGIYPAFLIDKVRQLTPRYILFK